MSERIMDYQPDDSNRITLMARVTRVINAAVERLADAYLEFKIRVAYVNFLLAAGPCETRRYLNEWVTLCASRSPAQIARIAKKHK